MIKTFRPALLIMFTCFLSTCDQYDKKSLQPDISFLIADLKWNQGVLKILELGEGPQSFFQGFDELVKPGIIWSKFWKCLKQFDLPMWYVGKKPNTPERIAQFAFEEFLSYGGRWIESLNALEHSDDFKKAIAPQKEKALKTIKDCAGILIFSNHGYPNWYKKSLKKFKKKHTNFLIVNDAATPYVNHKYNTSLLFKGNLEKYRPRWIRCKKKYSSLLAQKILSKLQASRVVIKPLNAANGWGNIMVDAADLDETLKTILIDPEKLADLEDKSWSYWPSDGHKYFLVEEFITSQSIMVDDKPFDGTMRAVFVIKCENGNTDINYLGFCWKLPKYSLDDEGSIMQRYKSGFGSALVKKNIEHNVQKALDKLLPQLYRTILFARLI